MSKKASIGLKEVIYAIIALFLVAGVTYGTTDKFEDFNFFYKLFNITQNNTETQVPLLGINLEKGQLAYYTGDEWKTINEKNHKVYSINSHEFDTQQTKNAFYNYYVKKPRHPLNGQYQINANEWRYWTFFNIVGSEAKQQKSGNWFGNIFSQTKSETKGWAEVLFIDAKKNGYEGPQSMNLLMGVNDQLRNKNDLSELKLKEEFLNANYDQAKQELISWRDQILSGGACEAFMQLEFSVDGAKETKTFKVKKIEEYLFIDLENTALTGEQQKYDDPTCFKQEIYDDTKIDRSTWINQAVVVLHYKEIDPRPDQNAKLWYGLEGKNWKYQGDRIKKRNGEWEEPTSLPINTPEFKRIKLNEDYISQNIGLHAGLEAFSAYRTQPGLPEIHRYYYTTEVSFNNPGRNDIEIRSPEGKIKVIETGMTQDYDTTYKKTEGRQLINKMIYQILTAYNKHLEETISQEFLTGPEYYFTPTIINDQPAMVLNHKQIINTQPLEVNLKKIDRIIIAKLGLGTELEVYDVYGGTTYQERQLIGTVNPQGIIKLGSNIQLKLQEEVHEALISISNQKIEGLYYDFGQANNPLTIKEASIPEELNYKEQT